MDRLVDSIARNLGRCFGRDDNTQTTAALSNSSDHSAGANRTSSDRSTVPGNVDMSGRRQNNALRDIGLPGPFDAQRQRRPPHAPEMIGGGEVLQTRAARRAIGVLNQHGTLNPPDIPFRTSTTFEPVYIPGPSSDVLHELANYDRRPSDTGKKGVGDKVSGSIEESSTNESTANDSGATPKVKNSAFPRDPFDDLYSLSFAGLSEESEATGESGVEEALSKGDSAYGSGYSPGSEGSRSSGRLGQVFGAELPLAEGDSASDSGHVPGTEGSRSSQRLSRESGVEVTLAEGDSAYDSGYAPGSEGSRSPERLNRESDVEVPLSEDDSAYDSGYAPKSEGSRSSGRLSRESDVEVPLSEDDTVYDSGYILGSEVTPPGSPTNRSACSGEEVI